MVTETREVQPESRMLIDGELVEADSRKTFDNVNPATEEVIGSVTDASGVDMDRAISAARRAFDSSDWSTNLTCAGSASNNSRMHSRAHRRRCASS